MNTPDRLFAARLYAATFLVQRGRFPFSSEIAEARGVNMLEATDAIVDVVDATLRTSGQLVVKRRAQDPSGGTA